MRDKELAEVLAAIYRCLVSLNSRARGLDTQMQKDLEKIRKAVEGTGGSVD